MTCQYPRLADPSDIPRLVSGEDVSSSWPPPGMDVVPVGHPEPWALICGDEEMLQDGDWYVTTLAEFVLAVPTEAVSIMLWAARLFTGPIALAYGAVGAWPVIYEVGKGRTMRWIKTTIKGTLGGVEQFQFGLNFGNPGSDPDLDSDECQALAVSLATKWQATLNSTSFSGLGGAAWTSQMPPDVKYTHVGVCMNTQTEATDSDGGGGNLSQADPTEWAPINGVAGVVGTSSVVALPYEVACCVTLHTDHAGQSGRGRIYLPPMPVQGMQAGGKFVSGWVTAAGQAVGSYFDAVIAGEGFVPVVVSRRRIILNEVKQITVGLIPDSQRRRRWAQLEAPIVAWTQA